MFLIMGDEIIVFNHLAKGRCRDKFLAMKHICGLSDLQYDILVEKMVQWACGPHSNGNRRQAQCFRAHLG